MSPPPPLLLSLLLLFSLSIPSSSASTALGFGRKVGGRSAVPDVGSNREVQELGRFSVEEYNRRTRSQIHLLLRRVGPGDADGGGGSLLYFSRVVAAERQVVSGIKYYLKLKAEAPPAEAEGMFEAVVVVKPWLEEEGKRRELLSFRPLPNHHVY